MNTILSTINDLMTASESDPRPLISGGDGTSQEDAIVIENNDGYDAVELEYDVIEQYYSIESKEWQFIKQRLCFGKGGRMFDHLEISVTDGNGSTTVVNWFFDISKVFGNKK